MQQYGQQYQTQLLKCPFDHAHLMPRDSFIRHIDRCKAKNKQQFKQCQYDRFHYIKLQYYANHVKVCPSKRQYADSNTWLQQSSHLQNNTTIKSNIKHNGKILNQSLLREVNQDYDKEQTHSLIELLDDTYISKKQKVNKKQKHIKHQNNNLSFTIDNHRNNTSCHHNDNNYSYQHMQYQKAYEDRFYQKRQMMISKHGHNQYFNRPQTSYYQVPNSNNNRNHYPMYYPTYNPYQYTETPYNNSFQPLYNATNVPFQQNKMQHYVLVPTSNFNQREEKRDNRMREKSRGHKKKNKKHKKQKRE